MEAISWGKHAAVSAVVLLALVPLAWAGPAVPCSDTSFPTTGCPDLVVEASDLRNAYRTTETFASTDCAVQEGMVTAGTRTLLRFTFTTPNIGKGDLIIGAAADHPAWFEWASCHGHYHFREYADYRLWTPDGYAAWTQARANDPSAPAQDLFDDDPSLLNGFVAGQKQGFCVIDLKPVVPGIPANYEDCTTDQGISVGWADQYISVLEGQWIDITGLAPGAYILEAEVNAERLFEESDYTNNAAAAPLYFS